MTISAPSQSAIDRLNAINKQLGSPKVWTLGHGGWAYVSEPGQVTRPVRASALPALLAKRERQLVNFKLQISQLRAM